MAYPDFEPTTAERISTFRSLHEPERAKLVRAHITLVFGVANQHLHAVSGLVEAVTSQTRVLPIVLGDCEIQFDPFEAKYKLFLRCTDGKEQINLLHHQLYDGAHRSELSSAHPFEPHMTVATYNSRAEIDRVEVSEIGELPIAGKLTGLDLVRFEDGRLTTLKTAPLIS